MPLALAGAIALALAGCGRKGPLDPPPGGMALEGATTQTAVSSRGEQTPLRRRQQEYDENGRPIAPAGPRRSTPADWLLD